MSKLGSVGTRLKSAISSQALLPRLLSYNLVNICVCARALAVAKWPAYIRGLRQFTIIHWWEDGKHGEEEHRCPLFTGNNEIKESSKYARR